nr:ribonuclease R family protein [Acetobacter sp. P5B1]
MEADRIPVSPPDILRAFGLPTHLKAALRTHLHAMAVAGDLACLPPGRLKGVTGLPETARAIITRMGRDGLSLAHLPDDTRGSTVALVTPHLDGNLLIPGDELILRLRPATGRTRREGRPIRLLSTASRQIAAVFQPARPAREAHPPSERKPDQLIPCDRRLTRPLAVVPDAASPRPAPGDVVLADLLPTQDGQPPQARIHASLGPATAPGMPATLSLLTHTIPTKFPAEVEEEACRVAQPPLRPESPAAPSAASAERRTDLRSLPLVTIDDATAEDFDDAIWAERTADGFRLIIAIADVAHYVAPGSALDAEARKRGNSVYLPGRVVPMLPPTLSAGVCSLKPGEDRLCLFIELEITPTGQIRSGKLGRGIMRSAARLTYQAVQQELDNATPPDLILTLQAAALALQADATARGVLSQPEAEYRVTLDEAGQPAEFSLRERQPAHDLVAAFMIAANRFAAEELMRHNAAGLFRVHPAPPASSSERTGGPRLPPRMQARYAASPGRHYGLALEHYAHFTSPIRRYADLVTHRALLATLERDARIAASLQPDRSDLPALAEHLQLTERRAASAVQTCQDRLAAIFLTPFIGHTLQAHVTAATRSGLAVTLTKTGTPSFLSFLALPDDSGMHDDSLPMRSDLSSGTRFLNSGLLPVVLTATHPAQGTLTLAPAPLRHAS